MARRSNFTSIINTLARDSARRQRQIKAEQKRQERLQIKTIRNTEISKKLQDKENKQRYLEARIEETAQKNIDLTEQINALQNILEHTLNVDDTISFESLRILDEYSPIPIPRDLSFEKPAPDKQEFLSTVKAPGIFENVLGLKGRYQREIQIAESQFAAALNSYEASEKERKDRLAELIDQSEEARRVFNLKVNQRNEEVSELEKLYKDGDNLAVMTYNSMVLEQSEYPEHFPQNFELAYSPDSKELVIEYELPNVSIVPDIIEYKYVKTKDEIEPKKRKPSEIKELYQDIVASIALRTLHEVFEADQGNLIGIVTFNGFVKSVDVATGKDISPYLVSVRSTRDKFLDIDLSRVDKRLCLRNLGAQVSPQPQAMQSVKPIVDFNMLDKRYIDQGDILSDLESRPNLMDLNPSEFENLVSNLFSKMGLETKLTRASRDGGVDAIAYDMRPILGGKVVIQAKRYKNTVGVSSVRDLYGTMLNEGASKGIIVTTSHYGTDAYEFSKDKQLELIDGGGLLYLLDQVGIKAQIVMPDE